MPTRIALVLTCTVLAAHLSAAEAKKPAMDLVKYQACVTAATSEETTADQMIDACREPAEAGIPGAQYALGVGLFRRNQAGDRTAAMDWLEKSVATNSPPAALAFAGILLQEQTPASRERGLALFRQAACAGYPPALEVLEQQGGSREALGCEAATDEDFTGEWIADLKWVKLGVLGDSGEAGAQLKLAFAGDEVRVFMKGGSEWTEVKPGSFKVTHVQQSISVASLEPGWDFDGKWIEAWTIQMLRTGPNEAAITFLRTVNNPHLPSTLSWRTFSTLAEGKAQRAK